MPDYRRVRRRDRRGRGTVAGGFACRAVGARPVPLPGVRHLEDRVLPSADAVVDADPGLLLDRP